MKDFTFTVTDFLLLWIALISLITVIITVYDKIAAKKYPRRRIPENTLMYLGVMGGAAAEFITMKIIRHKTLHKKFMVGLPVITVIHAVILFFVFRKFN